MAKQERVNTLLTAGSIGFASGGFAEALSERPKSDKIDAHVLAEFAERMPFITWEKPRDEGPWLRSTARRLSALTTQRTEAKKPAPCGQGVYADTGHRGRRQ